MDEFWHHVICSSEYVGWLVSFCTSWSDTFTFNKASFKARELGEKILLSFQITVINRFHHHTKSKRESSILPQQKLLSILSASLPRFDTALWPELVSTTLAWLHCAHIKFQMSAFNHFTKINIMKLVLAMQWRGLTVRVQCRRPGAKTTEVEARVAT